MNAATSQHVFAGPYLDDGAEREKFSAAFMDMTQGFLAFPLCLPGTQVPIYYYSAQIKMLGKWRVRDFLL
jgi:hypothetical protein